MSDKEVGELWRMFLGCCERGTDDEAVNAGVLLVRKLVEERKKVLRYRYTTSGVRPRDLPEYEPAIVTEALNDFCINEAEWEHPNG